MIVPGNPDRGPRPPFGVTGHNHPGKPLLHHCELCHSKNVNHVVPSIISCFSEKIVIPLDRIAVRVYTAHGGRNPPAKEIRTFRDKAVRTIYVGVTATDGKSPAGTGKEKERERRQAFFRNAPASPHLLEFHNGCWFVPDVVPGLSGKV